MADNPNVVISAKMTDEELLKSIDATLNRSEAKFTQFATDINATLGKIGEGFGKGMSTNFNAQVDAMSKKIKELEAQIKGVGVGVVKGKEGSTTGGNSTININDIQDTLASEQSLDNLNNMKKSVAEYRKLLTEGTVELKNTNALYDKIAARAKEAEMSQKSLTLAQQKSNATDIKGGNDVLAERNKMLDIQLTKEQQEAAAWASFEAQKQQGVKTTEQILNERYNKEQEQLQKVEILKQKQMSADWTQKENQEAKDKLATEKQISNELLNQQVISAKSSIQMTKAMPEQTYNEVEAKLKSVRDIQQKLENAPILSKTQINGVTIEVDRLSRKLMELKPINMQSVMGMSEANLNDISAKMQAISSLRGNYGKGAPEMAQLNKEYQRLSVVQREALSTGIQAERTNNKLATSFENLGRRVLFYTGLGALTGFVRQLYQIRGEYEMLERSMGALLGDFGKGTELFNQIQAQALKSPLTVIDLSTAAKQLVAYNFNLGEIADTTRRVADLSSALGVPIERLVYNLGQIKSKQVLDARDARDFANAGFAIVPMLAKMYTAQKRMGDSVVTTSQVYDMMTKKMVSYSDVMKVINQATDKGGMFFDYQSKQAETLKGQLSNLTDAWNLMLNDMGEDNQGVLTGTVSITRKMLANWREIKTILTGLIVTYGAVKAGQLILNNAIGQNVVGLNKEILANKSKVASDLLRIKMTRDLTEVEEESLRQTKVVSVADYASALATKNLTKEQLMLKFALASKNSIVRQAIISNKMLTETEIAQATAMGRLPAILRMISLGFKTLAASVGTFMSSMLPMLALTAVITVVAKLISKWQEHQQQLEEINKQYSELKDKVVDISVNFKIAAVGSNLDEMKTKLADLISFAKEEFNLDITINTDKLNTEEVTQKFTELRNQINLIMAKSQAFQENVTGKETKQLESAGKQIDKIYNNLLTINKDVSNTLIDNLQGVKLGVMSQQYVESIKQAQTAGESNIEYIKRMYEAYKGLGLVWDAMDISGEKLAVNMSRLGLSTDKVNTDNIKNLSASIEFAFSTVKNIVPKIQKELEKADAKTLDDKKALIDNWVKSAKLTEMQRQILYDEFKIEFTIGPAKDLTNQLEGWKLSIQNYLKENPLKLTDEKGVVTLSPVNVDALLNQEGKSLTSIQQQAKQDYDEAKAEYDALAGLKLQGLATDKDVSDQYLIMKEKEHISNVVGYNDKKDEEKQISKIAQSIKDEIGLIENLTGSYDKLTKAGMSNKDALSLLNDEYKESISIINTTLSKYGLPQFDLANFAGKDVSGQLAYLEELKKVMKTKGLDKIKPDAYKEVNAQIGKITVDAKTYDLSRVTEGLQDSLSNIKESYELGLEIEADPELGGLFSSMFEIDTNSLIKTAGAAINALQQAWDKQTINYNKLNPEKSIGATDLMTTKPEDLAESLGLEDSSAIIKEYKDFYDYAHKIRLDDYKNTTKAWGDLLAKYSEYEYKKNEIQKTAATERLGLIQKFGTDEQYKQALDLSTQIKISDDPQTIMKLQEELKTITDSVVQGNQQAIPIAVAISTKSGQETANVDFEQFKNSDLYIKAFDDLGRVGSASLENLYDELMKFSNNSELDMPQIREIMRQLKSVREEIQNRDPFKVISDGLREWKKAQDDLDAAKLAKDVNKQADAEERLKKAQDDVKGGLNGVNNAFSKFANLGNDVISLLKSIADGLGITFDEDTALIIDSIGKALSVTSAAMGVFIAVEEIMTITTATLMTVLWPLLAVTAALAVAFSIFGKKKDTFSGMNSSLEALAETINNVSDSLTEMMEKATGAKAISYYNKIIENNKKLEQSYRDLAKAAGESGSGVGSHSYAYRTNKALANDFSTMSALVGKPIKSIQDLYKLSSDELILIRDNMPEAWNKMSSEIRDALDGIIQYSESAKDALDKLNEALTGITYDNVSDDFLSMLSDMDSDASTFADNFENYMRNAIMRTIVYGEDFKEAMANWYSQFTEFMADGILSQDEKDILQKGYKDMTDEALKKRDAALDAAGISSSSSAALSALQQGIQGITEETGGAIESYMNNLNGQVFKQGSILQEMLNISKASLGGQSQMLLQMQQSYQVQQAIQSILSGWSNGSGRAMRVEMI